FPTVTPLRVIYRGPCAGLSPGNLIWKVHLIISQHFVEISRNLAITMIYLCDVCLKCESVSLVTLVSYERYLALKLIKNDKKNFSQTQLRTCRVCYKKLKFFKRSILFKVKLKIEVDRITSSKMHYPNYPPGYDEETFSNQYFNLKQPTDDAQSGEYLLPVQNQSNLEVTQPEQSCTDDYNCQCDSCQNKYGDLPVLLQGIEQKTFNEKTGPQPSTSSHSSSKKILTCEYCKKTFTHKGDFNKHLRKHTKEKPFSCQICHRKFGHTSNLLRHQRLHSGEKPFACDNCDKRFSRKDKLDCHKRSRTCYEASTSHSYQ
ncbi:unnamed protein product, partial [Psylliodes chrysocephalus]